MQVLKCWWWLWSHAGVEVLMVIVSHAGVDGDCVTCRYWNADSDCVTCRCWSIHGDRWSVDSDCVTRMCWSVDGDCVTCRCWSVPGMSCCTRFRRQQTWITSSLLTKSSSTLSSAAVCWTRSLGSVAARMFTLHVVCVCRVWGGGGGGHFL